MSVPEWDDMVSKKDTAAVFKALKSKRDNKVCIDCPQQNPTWATIPHGSFLCLSCAGTHRSIGVHITFVRSTNMDEWTWGQLRLMQVGGNPKAIAHYNKSGLTTNDLSEKYQSSVAASYRTKLEREARKFHKKLGGNLFESSTAGGAAAEADFFDAAADEAKTVTAPAMKLAPVAAPVDPSSKLSSSLAGGKKKLLLKKKGGKKPKKGGLGAVKKSNTKANFDEIASRVNGEDEERAKVAPIEAASTEAITKRLEKFAVKTTSRDMSKMDEAKLAQAERLGMGRSRQTTNASVFSHSTSSAMQEVVQESDAKGNSVFADRDSRGGYLDREPRSTLDSDGYGGGNDDDFFKQSYGK